MIFRHLHPSFWLPLMAVQMRIQVCVVGLVGKDEQLSFPEVQFHPCRHVRGTLRLSGLQVGMTPALIPKMYPHRNVWFKEEKNSQPHLEKKTFGGVVMEVTCSIYRHIDLDHIMLPYLLCWGEKTLVFSASSFTPLYSNKLVSVGQSRYLLRQLACVQLLN